LKDKRKLGKSAEPDSNESEDKEDEVYCSDKGNNLPSRTCLREEREKQKRNKDRNDNRQCSNNKRNNNVNSSDSEDGEDTLVTAVVEKHWIKDSRDGKSDSPGKVMRGSKRGESGNPGTRMMRVRNKEYK
jgi:hypothetical protein